MSKMLEDNSPVKANGPSTAQRNRSQVGGWADENNVKPTTHSGTSGRNRKQDSDDDVPVVPETEGNLEEIDRFLASNLKSESLKRVAAYKELNSNIVSKQKLLQSLDGVDLRVLTKNLLPESQLHEADVPWNWDVVFAEIVPDLQKDNLIEEKS